MPQDVVPFDLTGALPFDRDANDSQPVVLGVAPEHFLYIGQGLTVAQFAAYVQSFIFGRIPPDYVVLHHTAIPSIRAMRSLFATRTVLSYSQFELALLSLCAQAIAYYARTGKWPRLAPHDSDYDEVWT